MVSSDNLIGLVLAGGKSRRLGQDKSQLRYHGIAQELYLYDLMLSLGLSCYISKGNDAVNDNTNYIKDDLSIKKSGPVRGIVSAFRKIKPDAILVIACDLPFINKKIINQLINARDRTYDGTIIKHKMIEPLVCIYEHATLSQLTNMCNQKLPKLTQLITGFNFKIVEYEEDQSFLNVNHPEDLVKAQLRLRTNNLIDNDFT